MDKDGFINVPPAFAVDCPRLPERQKAKLLQTLEAELFEKCRFKRKPLLFLDSAFDVQFFNFISFFFLKNSQQKFKKKMAPTPLDDFENPQRLLPLPFPDEKIRKAFLRFFTSIFQKYRQFMIHPDDKKKDPNNKENPLFCEFHLEKFFKKSLFLKEASTDSCKIFMGKVLETQSFTKFLLDRLTSQNTQEVVFFDESIDAKTNRSKLKIYKKETPFLNDASLKIENTVIAMEADESNLPSDKLFMYPEFPEIDPTMCNPPRAAKLLVSLSEVQKNNNHVFQSWKTILVMLWSESRQMENNPNAAKGIRFNGVSALKKMPQNSSAINLKNAASGPSSGPAIGIPSTLHPTGPAKQFPRLGGQPNEYDGHLRSISFGEIDFDVSEFDSEFSDMAQNEHVLTETGQVMQAQKASNFMGNVFSINNGPNNPAVPGETPENEAPHEILETNNVLRRLSFDADEECPNPGCKKKLSENEVRANWGTDANDYTTKCPLCKTKFDSFFFFTFDKILTKFLFFIKKTDLFQDLH